jgi:hypothetical protein
MADVPSGLSLTPPQETNYVNRDRTCNVERRKLRGIRERFSLQRIFYKDTLCTVANSRSTDAIKCDATEADAMESLRHSPLTNSNLTVLFAFH